MDDEIKEVPAQTHEDILRERDAKIEALRKEIASNPEAEWREIEVIKGLKVKIPAQAEIEAESLILDASSHIDLFRSGVEVLAEHGDIVRNPRNFGLLMSGISEGNRDWKGIQARITLQRCMSICEDKMDKLDYDPEKPGFNAVHKIYKEVERLFDSLDHLAPMKTQSPFIANK